MVSSELKKLIEYVHYCIIEKPINLIRLHSSLEELIFFLTTSSGRTKENCEETDFYFLLHEDKGFIWDHLPKDYQLILDDIGGHMHDTIEAPQIA